MNDDDTSTPITDTSPPADSKSSFDADMDREMAATFDRLEAGADKQDHREGPLSPPTEAGQPSAGWRWSR